MLYLELYHGRKNPDQDLEDWGFDGPIIGPLEHMTFTYLNVIRVFFTKESIAKACGFEGKDDNWITFEDDLLVFQGNYYGDFSLIDLTKDKVKEMKKEVGRINAITYKKYNDTIVSAAG